MLNSFPVVAPNSSALPYSVRFKGWRLWLRIVGYGGGIALLLMGAFALLSDPDAQNKPLLGSFWFVGVLFCLVQLWRLRAPLATFYPDRVEKPGLFRQSVLHRANIAGVGKVVQTRYGSYFEISSSSRVEPGIHLDGYLRKDPIVDDWLRGAPDPEAEALKADRARILADPRYGASETDRARRLDRTKQWVMGFNIACLALAGWLGFLGKLDPTSVLLALATLGVAAAIVASSNGLVIWAGKGKANPVVAGAFVPALALAARAGFTVHLLDYQPFVWPAVLVGTAAALYLYSRLVTSASRAQTAISLGVFSGLAAYGFAIALNVGLDTSPHRLFLARVNGEHVSHGKSTSYYLELGPWADHPSSEISVSSSLYDDAPVGSEVCVLRHPGAFAQLWIDVTMCPSARRAVAPESDQAPPPGVTNPDWIKRPTGEDLAELYPERAQRLGRSGAATVQCLVRASGAVTDCRVVSEEPAGFGFGSATIQAAGRFRMKPQTINGRPVDGASVTIPVRWQLQ